MKNLPILPLAALTVACCLFGSSFSDAKVKSPSAMLMCLLFTLVTGIGFWIHSLEPCDKSKPGVEDKLLKKLTPSTPNCWKKLMNKIKFWWNSEDIDDLKDKNLLKERNNSVPNLTELEDKPNKDPQDKSKPDYNSKDGKNDSPMKGRSLSNLPSYDKKPASRPPTLDTPKSPDSKSSSVNSSYNLLPSINNQDDDPKSAKSPPTKPSVDNKSADSKLPPSRSVNDSLGSAEIGKWHLDSPADRKKSSKPSSGKGKNCRREIILTAVCSTLITIAVIGGLFGLYKLFPEFFNKIFSVFQ